MNLRWSNNELRIKILNSLRIYLKTLTSVMLLGVPGKLIFSALMKTSWILVLSCGLVTLARAVDSVPELTALQQRYQKPVQAVGVDLEDKLKRLNVEYTAWLTDWEKALIARGDLDAVLAVKAERERVKTGSGTGTDPKNLPVWLASQRARYDATWARTAQDALQQQDNLNRLYARDLEALQRLLTQRGQLEAAIQVKQEREQVLAMLTGEKREPVDAMVPIVPGKAIADKALVLHFIFDSRADAKVRDQSGNNNHGKVVGATAEAQGLRFKGNTSSYVVVPRSESLEPGEGITVAMWLKGVPGQEAGQGWATVLRKMADCQPGYGIRGGGVSSFMIYDKNPCADGRSTSVSFQPFSGTRWQHIAATYSSADGRVKSYQDGELVNEAALTKRLFHSGDLYLGGTAVRGDDGGFRGLIREIRIYSRALSTAEIKMHQTNRPAER